MDVPWRKSVATRSRSSEIAQKAFRDEHPTTAAVHNNLGLIYRRLGEHRLAKVHTEGALKTYREMFGDDHPGTGAALINVGDVYAALGDHAKALELKKQALHIHIHAFGETHPETASVIDNIGGPISISEITRRRSGSRSVRSTSAAISSAKTIRIPRVRSPM